MRKSLLYKSFYIIVFCCFLSLFSCHDYLDRETDSYINKEMTFKSYERASRYLVSIYTIIPDGLNRFSNGGMFAGATDDGEQALESSNIQLFNTGSWNSINNPDDLWNRMYAGIRMASEFMENADQINLDAYKIDPANQTEYNNRLKDIKIWKAEALFLRAYFHFELLKRYGPIPIVTSPLSINDNYENLNRPSMDECIDFISKECDEAANILEVTPWRDITALGHATKGAALALKSRVLLYTASPLYLDWENISENSKPSNKLKWETAAKAAKAVIDLDQYSLQPSYKDLFANNFQSREFIFMRRYPANMSYESFNFPASYGGKGGLNPSQNLIDAYEMKDGTFFDWSNLSQASQPYKNRDARLEATIITNGMIWQQKKVETWFNGKDGKHNANATKTGYYLKKHTNESVNILTEGGALGHTWPIFRLSEIYLNYAEALNEYDPNNPGIREYVNYVRMRAGQPDLPVGLSQSEMRTRIQNERRVEFAFEEHRAWDVRRWKIASSTLGSDLKGVQVTKKDEMNDSYEYVPYVVESRVFEPKMYWYPIPQSEKLKLKSWNQNPGW